MTETNGENGNGGKTRISGNTWVQGGLVISLLSAAVWVGWAYRNNSATMEALATGQRDALTMLAAEQKLSLERMSLQFDNRFNALELRMIDRFSGTDAKLWALRLQQANPKMVVPEPNHEAR